MIKFRYKRKDISESGSDDKAQNANAPVNPRKIEALKDRLVPSKEMLTLGGSVAAGRNNTLPRARPSHTSSSRPQLPPPSPLPSPILNQTTIALFRVSPQLQHEID